MYRILYGGELMHDPSLNDDMFIVFDPVLNEEANMAASLTFVIYPTNARYNDLVKMVPGTVEAYDGNDLIFRGRIISDDQGWLNQKSVTCESDMAYLNDTIVRPYSYTGSVSNYLQQLITSHNAQVAASKRFTLRNVTVTDPNNNIVRSSTQYPTTWAEIKEKLIDNLGGYLVTEYSGGVIYLDYLADISSTAYQTIELSKNLLSFSRKIKGENYITALIPLGATIENSEERVTIKSVNSGNDYIVSPAASTYGLIFGTEIWEDVTVPANLLTKAQARLAELALGETTIELSALDLHLVDDNVHSLRFLTYVNCIDAEHDFSGNFLITQKTTDMANPGNSTITFGANFGGLTGYTSKTKGDVENIVRDYVKNDKIFEVNESISTLSSELTQTASEIRAEVSAVQTDVGDLETRVTSAEAAIVVNANNISSKVSQTDYNGATIASLINQSASTVTIQAQHIKLEGAITANQTFSIDNSGFMTTVGGHIGGWTIGSHLLSSSATISGSTYLAFMQEADGSNRVNSFGVSKTTNGTTTYPFRVTYDGKLYATDATVTGTINATGGSITGNVNVTGTLTGGTLTGGTISGSHITGSALDISGTTGNYKYSIVSDAGTYNAMELTYGRSNGTTVSEIALWDEGAVGAYISGTSSDRRFYVSHAGYERFQVYPSRVNINTNLHISDSPSSPRTSTWDSVPGSSLTNTGILSLRSTSTSSPGIYLTAYDSTTSTYDAGFYYNATNARLQATAEIYAPSLTSGSSITSSGSITNTNSSNSSSSVSLYANANGTAGVYHNGASSSIVYMDSNGARGPLASTSENGFMSASDKTKLDGISGWTASATTIADKNLSSGTTTQNIGSFTLAAGYWMVYVVCRFQSNATGRRMICLATSSTADGMDYAAIDVGNAVNGTTTYLKIVHFLHPTATTTYYVNGYQNSGSQLTVNTRYGAWKILS